MVRVLTNPWYLVKQPTNIPKYKKNEEGYGTGIHFIVTFICIHFVTLYL